VQRGAIKQHGKFWVLKYREDVLQNGVRVRKDVYKKLAPIDREHQTKESVQPLADVILVPLNAGTAQATSVDSLLSFLQTFLAKGEGGRGRKLQHTTVGAYQDMFRILMPHLPDMELRRVRTPDIDKLLRRVAENDGENRRAQTTYRNLKNFLSSAFRYAVRNGLVDFNPVRDAAIPEGDEADTYAYNLTEVRAIMKALKKPVAKAAVMVATFTGLRVEEIKGLRWEDYDGKVLNIRRAVAEGKLVEVKTKASRAPVPVVGIVKKVLADHLRLNSGDGYIFHGDTGEPIRMENLARRDIIPKLEKAGIEWHGFHAFRRGLATVLHDMGVAELTIKHILRHSISASNVTGKHYIKPSLERSREALQQVEKQYLKLRKRSKR
jgi:integrase